MLFYDSFYFFSSIFFCLELVINRKDQPPKRDMARDYEQFTERKCKWLLNF